MEKTFREIQELLQRLQHDGAFLRTLDMVPERMIRALKNGNKIFWCGNGGSAAQCQHLSAELLARLRYSRPALASLALTADTAFLTAWVNDNADSRQMFSRQIEALGKPGDILIALSTSGNSPNILAALESARKYNMESILFGGKGGGKAAGLADIALIVPSDCIQRIQEVHIMTGHRICEKIEDAFLSV
ncbi:MAG: SIS domain-containing protein [Candidatus Marinimicrobia bacterium]|nr:SIS domain-containing protein [Candidatus Neomarinimicrobiota bacterium]MDD5709358.1 SIS domain-containing protein [Candidatus Neomarinimicrobiota bacterium]